MAKQEIPTTRNITIENLSSGDVLHFRSTSITKYSSRYNINYDSTQVIGRMDPIRNFKNTERIINASFFVETKQIHLYKQEDNKERNKDIFSRLHEGTEEKKDKERIKLGTNAQTNPSILFNNFNRFFYPSYEQEPGGAGQYFMKSAPIFRVSFGKFVVDKSAKKTTDTGFFFCTIPTFDVVSLSERASVIRGLPPGVDVNAKGGSTTVLFNSYDFDLTMHVINVNENSVSSILINRGNTQTTEKKVLGQSN